MAQMDDNSPPLDDNDFDAYSDADLVRLHDELRKRNTLLEAENNLFESFLDRVVPHALRADHDGTGDGKDGATGAGGGNGGGGEKESEKKEARREERKRKKGEKAKEVDKPTLLTPEHKAEIATRELEELRDEIEKQKEEWAKVLDNFKAEIEEVEIRVSEIKKAVYEFRRDIVQQAVNSRTGKIIAERVLRYFEDKIRSKDAIIEKVRLKNATLKAQKNKLHLQLKQKEEMGEVLHAIDFDQLQIENKQYLAKIEERNAELLKLKMTAGKTVQILNFYKKRLHALTEESVKLRCEIDQRRDLLEKLNVEGEVVMDETKRAEKTHKKLKEQMDELRVPDVMDYVHLKAQQHELVKKLRSWDRKVEIASMQAQRYHRHSTLTEESIANVKPRNRMKKIWHQMQESQSAQANGRKHLSPIAS
ncbi:hypothetical protein HK101_007712 [Irineochytrium annulatum]|nr:hypothetical protein HK101_007712 [Irineochytrium annulatum]